MAFYNVGWIKNKRNEMEEESIRRLVPDLLPALKGEGSRRELPTLSPRGGFTGVGWCHRARSEHPQKYELPITIYTLVQVR